MIYVRSIFKSWKNWVESKKSRSDFSITPVASIDNFPGENTVMSEFQESF